VKIVDFGIAKLMVNGDKGRTQTGTVMGTPAYMSPEQALGDSPNIDARSDIYSLGAVMFQLATGRLPFEETTFGNLIIAHVQKAPPLPRSRNPAIPERWEQLILRALEKRAGDRPQTMTELHDELWACMQELGVSAELPVDDGARSDGAGTARMPSEPG